MLLRIEDTDVERNRPELIDNIFEMIEWLGLGWDGEPVHQSDRLDLYTAAAEKLLAEGRAYWCDCTAERVQARARKRGGPPGYDGFCRDRDLERGPSTALRFRTPDEGSTGFDDLVRGEVRFENAKLEDFVLLRSNGTPTFLLANIVDDADMGITHVVRGEEHVNGTPKYLLMAEALGLGYRPAFAHLPVLVNELVVSVIVPLVPPVIVTLETVIVEAFAVRMPPLPTFSAPPVKLRLAVARAVVEDPSDTLRVPPQIMALVAIVNV